MKTFEQCCDEVAKEFHYLPMESSMPNGARALRKDLVGKAAELYTHEKVKEAIKLARVGAEWEVSAYSGKPINKLSNKQIFEKLGL